ncbi:hypothetical protein pb186bvf_006127 [Paramecium bursaria]
MQSNERFVQAVSELDTLLSELQDGKIKLAVSLKEVSMLHSLQNKLQEFKLLNSIYAFDSRIKSQLRKSATQNLQVQDDLCYAINQEIQQYMIKFEQLEKIILYILNQTLNKECMLEILKSIGQITLGVQNFVILDFVDQLHVVSTNKIENAERLYDILKGNEPKEWIHELDTYFQGQFGFKNAQVIRTMHQRNSNCIIIYEKNNNYLPQDKSQLKQLSDQILAFAYDYIQGIYNKETMICSVRAINQFLIINAPNICQTIIKDQIQQKYNTKCEIINSKTKSVDDSFAITDDFSQCYIPVGYNGKKSFYINIQNPAIDLITFSDYLQQLWQRFHHQLREQKNREFLQQIIEVSNPSKLVMGVDLDFNIVYQSSSIPSLWKFMDLSQQSINQYQNLSNVKMDLLYKNMIIASLEDVKQSKKGALDAGQIVFNDKSVDVAIYVKKDEANEIGQFYIVFDQPKKRYESQRQSKSDVKSHELAQEALHLLKLDKMEKACTSLKELMNLTLTVDEMLDLLREKEVLNVQEMDTISDDIKQSYVLEYFRTDNQPQQYRRQTIQDIIQDTPFQTKTLIQEQQLINAKKLDAFLLRQDDIDKLSDWSFDICVYKDNQIHYTWALFHILNFLDFFQIQKEPFFQFLVILEDRYNYRKNPYHNYEHGFTVAHACFYMIKNKLLDRYLDTTEQFAALLSSLCHDVDHTGRTNGFEVARMSKLAIRYNDESVLENHHVSMTFKIIQKDKYNILNNLSQEQFIKVRKFMVTNILATDMKKHFEIMGLMDLKYKSEELTREEDKKLISGFIVHACDLTQATKVFRISSQWSQRIQNEFDNQVEEERLLSLPVTQHLICQNLPKQELSFIKAIIKPLYELTNLVLSKGLKEVVENIERNQKEWEKQLK